MRPSEFEVPGASSRKGPAALKPSSGKRRWRKGTMSLGAWNSPIKTGQKTRRVCWDEKPPPTRYGREKQTMFQSCCLDVAYCVSPVGRCRSLGAVTQIGLSKPRCIHCTCRPHRAGDRMAGRQLPLKGSKEHVLQVTGSRGAARNTTLIKPSRYTQNSSFPKTFHPIQQPCEYDAAASTSASPAPTGSWSLH